MDTVKIYACIPYIKKKVERVGKRFNFNTLNSIEPLSNINNDFKVGDTYLAVDVEYLKSLNPKSWKFQDHYAVLGLGNLRFYATEEQVKGSYRKMVLQHHPDKRKSQGEVFNTDDDYFTCITRAYEILGNAKSRRAFDSVDPQFNDNLPFVAEIEKDLYGVFNTYFSLNARWSERKNVPSFGDEHSSREHLDNFYNFWYAFESWREFSYLDEEDKEKGQDREERRWIEKQNKTARIKRKREEMARLRTLVDLAYNCDKRIIKFKSEDKERKLTLKRAKLEAVKAQKEEQQRLDKEAKLEKEKADKVEQTRNEQIKTEKELLKRAARREKKNLRDKAKQCKYFADNEEDLLKNMEGVEKICEVLNLQELQTFNKKLEELGKDFFCITLQDIHQKCYNRDIIQEPKIETQSIKESQSWNNDSIQLLVKAVNIFPAGTSQRWDVIASFITQHSSCKQIFNSKQVLYKAKSLQNSGFNRNKLKQQTHEHFMNLEETRGINVNCKNKILSDENHLIGNLVKKNKLLETTSSKVWTKEEQALLEEAIKTYSTTTPDRWDRIAEFVPNRSKKECLRRVKELVELVNSKHVPNSHKQKTVT